MCIFENSLRQLVWMFSYWILKGKRIIWLPGKESGRREGGKEERGDPCRCMATFSSLPPNSNHFTHPWLVGSREQRQKEDMVYDRGRRKKASGGQEEGQTHNAELSA